MIEAYPLYWPTDYPRSNTQKYSRFKNTLAGARDFVNEEIRRLGAKNPIISTNIPLKNNGDMYADWQRYKIDDHGVAVYFTLKSGQVCLCCDTYGAIWENMQAIGRTIEALRQIDRDGVSDFLNRAFTGFVAISGPKKDCWEILGIKETRKINQIKEAYRELAKKNHPDNGGVTDVMSEINIAYEEAISEAEASIDADN
jgi:hypothetical protein